MHKYTFQYGRNTVTVLAANLDQAIRLAKRHTKASKDVTFFETPRSKWEREHG